MSVQLYHTNLSPPARAVRIVVKHLGLDVEEKEIDLLAGDHLKPEFTSINPFHCVPTLVDDGFTLWESRAVMTYLVDKFAHGDSIYPTDLKTRSTIDRWLFWDAGTFYASLAAYYGPVFRGGSTSPAAAELFKMKAKDLDSSLEKTKYVAGESLTLADMTIALTAMTASSVGIDLTQYKNIERWLKQVESDLTPSVWSDLVVEPSNTLGGLIKSKAASA